MEEENRSKEKGSEKAGHRESLDRLVEKGEWTRLGEDKEFQDLTTEGKILTLHEAIANRIKQLSKVFYVALKRQPGKAAKIQEKLHYLDETSEALSSVLAENIVGERTKDLKKAA